MSDQGDFKGSLNYHTSHLRLQKHMLKTAKIPCLSWLASHQILGLYWDTQEFFPSLIFETCEVSLHAKEYLRTIYLPITQTVCHYNPLLEIIPNAISESLYFVVVPYICHISALHFHCASPISSPMFQCDLAGRAGMF